MVAHQNFRSKSSSGFTLVELSIVLVIIGLIIGGVLVGQDLIRAAETRSQLRQFDEFNTAINTFRLKYNALPGDYNAAVANLGAAVDDATPCVINCTGNGNGNGVLEDSNGATGGYGNLGNAEMLKFWHHLGLSGLLAGGGNGLVASPAAGTTWPKAKIGNLGIVAFFSTLNGASSAGQGQHFFHMGKLNGNLTGYNMFLTPQQADEIDKKIDNGMPLSGSVNVRFDVLDVIDFTGPGWSAAVGTATDCIDGGTSFATSTTYNSDVGVGGTCNLRLKMSY